MAEKHPLPHDSLSGGFGGGPGAYGSEQKRIKLDSMEQQNVVIIQQPSGGGKGQLDPHNAPPSRVIHARAVPDGCTHTLLVNVLSQFGKIGLVNKNRPTTFLIN